MGHYEGGLNTVFEGLVWWSEQDNMTTLKVAFCSLFQVVFLDLDSFLVSFIFVFVV